MSDLKYLKPKADETYDILIITFILALMFSMFTVRFSGFYAEPTPMFLQFYAFLLILFFSRLIVMKYAALKNGFEIEQVMTFFNRYGVRSYDTAQYKFNKVKKYTLTKKLIKTPKGIASPILSLILYIFSMGFLIYPNLWKFKYTRIPHLHIGKSQEFETQLSFYRNYDISDYRISKSYIVGFFWYFVFALLFKLFFKGSLEAYYWMLFALFWIAFVSILPIPPSDGFELHRRHIFAWVMLLTILTLGMISLLVFEGTWFTVLTVVFASVFTFFNGMWNKIVHGKKY